VQLFFGLQSNDGVVVVLAHLLLAVIAWVVYLLFVVDLLVAAVDSLCHAHEYLLAGRLHRVGPVVLHTRS